MIKGTHKHKQYYKSVSDKKMITILLTFVIGELQVVVHGGHKLLYNKSPYNRCQVTFTPHFPL